MDKIKKRISELNKELLDLRRDFHRHPELGFEEHRTAGVVEGYLKSLGLHPQRMAETGIVALLEGSKPQPVLLLRADMDALPVEEENDVAYTSENRGVMHACGHDAHIAMLLVTAKILSENKNDIPGTIKFVFQPNEEIAGAVHMIADGVLQNPAVDAVVGLHIWTPISSGKIAVSAGPVMGGLDVFKIAIHGKGGHTGVPEDAVDPVLTAANVIQTVQMIQTREISNLRSTIIMFGKIEGGTKSNIIPDTVRLEGSIRFLYPAGPESEEQPTERFIRIVEQVCKTHRCTCEIDIVHENIPLINHEEMVRIVREIVGEVFMDEKCLIEHQTIASEDFSEFCSRVPGVFMFLGTGNEKKGTHFSHHNPRFNIDEETMPAGVEMQVKSALNFFRNADNLKFLKRR